MGQNTYYNNSSKFNAMSLEEMLIPALVATQAYNEMVTQINELSDYVMGILAKDVDAEMRSKMNAEYKRIQTLSKNLEANGLSQSIRTEYNAIVSRVKNEVVNYNNRVAAERASAERAAAKTRVEEVLRKKYEGEEYKRR